MAKQQMWAERVAIQTKRGGFMRNQSLSFTEKPDRLLMNESAERRIGNAPKQYSPI
jgi:hypothetical protein